MSKRNIAGTGRKQAEEAGSDSWLEFRRGIGAGVPLLVGYLPISVAFGVIAAQGNIPLGHAVAMSALVFAGASQFLAVNMIASGAGTAAVVLATFMINLRHLIMSLSLMSQLRPSSRWIRAAASFGITDETFAVASMEAEESKHPLAPAFLFGLILMAYGSWVTGTWLGGWLSSIIPASVGESMAVTLYAMFIGLLIPSVRKQWRRGLVALIGAGVCWLGSLWLGSGWPVVLATLVGGAAGMFVIDHENGGP